MTNEEEIELKKIVWSFMLEHGRITEGEWSYYGGHFEYPESINNNSWETIEKFKAEVYSEIREQGVDWEKTVIPDFEYKAEFVGTDDDSKWMDCLLGDLHLRNGKTYKLGTNKVSEYVSSAIESLKKKSKPDEVDLVEKWFG